LLPARRGRRFPTNDTFSRPKESRTVGSAPSASSACRYSPSARRVESEQCCSTRCAWSRRMCGVVCLLAVGTICPTKPPAPSPSKSSNSWVNERGELPLALRELVQCPTQFPEDLRHRGE